MYRITQANSLDETKTVEPEVISKLCDFIGGKIPLDMIQKFQDSGNNSPHKIVNLFGGNQQTLIRFIKANQLSLFLLNYPKITGNLFQMARLMFKEKFDTIDFPPHKWTKMKKTDKFDNKFIQMDPCDIKELCNSGDYAHKVTPYIRTMYEQICCPIKENTPQETSTKDIPKRSETMNSQEQLETKTFL